MTLNSIFDVGDLVQFKYSTNDSKNMKTVMEVIEVMAQKCYGGVQVFCMVRVMHFMYDGYGKDRKLSTIEPGQLKDHAFVKFREDELKHCSEETINLIKSIQ